jgi:23S rRNA (uracil1939-C5)-methyltransferase
MVCAPIHPNDERANDERARANRHGRTRVTSAQPTASRVEVLRIDRIGADGDGIGVTADGTACYVPFTLPGETVQARINGDRGVIETLITASPARMAPSCTHFGSCGGCALQHWRAPDYGAWKSGLLAAALRRAGYADVPLAPLVPTQPGTRRRVDLAVRRTGRHLALGLHRGRAAEVVEITVCTVLHPALVRLLAPLRAVLAGLGGLRREGSAVLNLLETGPDLLLVTDAALTTQDRTALTTFARAHGLPRISWKGRGAGMEPVCLLGPAAITLSGIPVAPPPGAFLQATPDSEAAIIAATLAGLPERLPAKARIAELYAGCGTLTFPLAQRARDGQGRRRRGAVGPAHGIPASGAGGAHHRHPAGPGPPAGAGEGTFSICRRGARPALCRRPPPDCRNRRFDPAPRDLHKL